MICPVKSLKQVSPGSTTDGRSVPLSAFARCGHAWYAPEGSNGTEAEAVQCLSITAEKRDAGSPAESWGETVVPPGAHIVRGQREFSQLLFSNFSPFSIDAPIQLRFHNQARSGLRASYECEHCIETTERLPGPVDAYVTEQPIFDRIPLGTPRWIMTDRQGETK